MSTRVQRRRGSAAAHATFIGAEGELTVMTDEKRVVVHDGATAGGIPMARLDEVSDEVQRAIGNADFSFQITDRLVVPSAAFTAPRTGTLPAASSVAAGRTISFFDALPAINGANVVTVVRSGSDTINGATSYVCSQPRGRWDFISDGVSKWSVVVEKQPLAATLTALAALTTTAFGRARLTDADAAAARAAHGLSWTTIYDQVVSGSAVSAIDVALNPAFSFYRIMMLIVPNSAVADFSVAMRVSSDNGANYAAGASDYVNSSLTRTGSTVSGSSGGTSSVASFSSVMDTAVPSLPALVRAEFYRGSGSTSPVLRSTSISYDGTSNIQQDFQSRRDAWVTATNLRFLAAPAAAGIGIGSRLIIEGC